ncbi:MAG: mannonate dehydratase [Bacteroidota bacterium]
MLHTWRWFGPDDSVSLMDIRQAGAKGIVTALHHIPNGEAWTQAAILERKQQIETAGLTWEVVESVPVHEAIKRGLPEREAYVASYCETLRNLAASGIHTVCYNFMPVLDWTRTNLMVKLAHGGTALGLSMVELAAFDLFILNREKAASTYSPEIIKKASAWYNSHDQTAHDVLIQNLLAGLPGAEESYSLDTLRAAIHAYEEIGVGQFRENLRWFLQQVGPTAREVGARLAIHPDDPPFSILGLPRIVSTKADLQAILDMFPYPENGLTLCTGSLGSIAQNDVSEIANEFGDRIHFIHLRNVALQDDGSFTESDHLEGNVNMVEVITQLLRWEQARELQLPMRPDHGHQLLSDLHLATQPGYTAIGRLKGLAEISGVEKAVQYLHTHSYISL